MNFNDAAGPLPMVHLPRLPTAKPLERITGAEGPLVLRAWINAMHRGFVAAGAADGIRAGYCGNFVLDEAATWYDTNNAATLGWDAFREAFLQRFIPHDVEAELLVQLFDLVQGGYPLSKYIARFETLYSTNHEELSGRAAKELFLRGLDSYLRTDAMSQLVPDLATAFSLARRLHTAKEQDAKVPKRKQGEIPTRPRAAIAQTPMYRDPDAMDVDLNQVEVTQILRDEQTPRTPLVRLCFRCRRPGHFKRECPQGRNKGKSQSGNAKAQ